MRDIDRVDLEMEGVASLEDIRMREEHKDSVGRS